MTHDLSVGLIFKDEASCLDEWINHYLNRNIDHLYLINDNSTDNYLEIINKYRDKITLFNVDEKAEETGRQVYFYNKFFKTILKETKWLGIFDIDEYVWSPYTIDLKKAVDLLKRKKIYYYSIPMVLFGSNNLKKQPDKIVNSFTKRARFDKEYLLFVDRWCQYKPIFFTEKIIDFHIHDHNVTCAKIRQDDLEINKNLFRLNHYRLQSEDKWKNNLEKTDVNYYKPPSSQNFSPNLNVQLNISKSNYRNMELFYESNKSQNIIEDFDLVNQNIKDYLDK